MVRKCPTCSNKEHTQDVLHGKGNRVHTTYKTTTGVGYRCTVCGHDTGLSKNK